MRKLMLIIVIVLFTGTVIAQESCNSILEALPSVAESCAEAESLCLVKLDSTGQSAVQTIALQDYMATDDFEAIETVSNEKEQSFAVLHLPLNDAPLTIFAFGNTRLENTVPLIEIDVTAVRGVNLRAAPSVESSVIGSLAQGQTYTAIGRLQDNTWLRVRLETGQIGWVSAQYLASDTGFAALSVVSPNSPTYIAMQAFDLSTEDACSGVLFVAPKSESTYELSINDLTIQMTGATLVNRTEDSIAVAGLSGEITVTAFGFEQNAAENEIISTPLNDSGMLSGIPGEAQNYEGLTLPYALFLPKSEDTNS